MLAVVRKVLSSVLMLVPLIRTRTGDKIFCRTLKFWLSNVQHINLFTNVPTTVCSWTSCYCGHKRLFLSPCYTPAEMKGHLGPDLKLESRSGPRYAGPLQVMSMLVQDRRPSLGFHSSTQRRSAGGRG